MSRRKKSPGFAARAIAFPSDWPFYVAEVERFLEQFAESDHFLVRKVRTMRMPGTRLVRAAMKDLYPRTDDLPGVDELGLDAFLEQVQREAPPLMWAGLVAGSALYVVSPIATVRIPTLVFFLPKALRQKHATKVTSTDIYLLRQAIFIVKMNAGFCWGAHDRVRTQFNLDPYPEDPGSYRTR